MINVKRLINTPIGRFFISVILGLGLATFFRKVCSDKNCIVFNGPVISEFDEKIYKYGGKCYKYSTVPDKCDKTKRIINVSANDNEKNPSSMPSILGGK